MTNDQIAERLGWKFGERPSDCPDICGSNHYAKRPGSDEWFCAVCYETYPDYMHDISAAWLLVEWVQKKEPGWRFSLLGGDVNFDWNAEFFGHIDPKQNYGERHASQYADTAPEAICKAFMEATK